MFSFRHQGLLHKKLKTLKRAVFEKEFHFSFTPSFWSILFLYQFIDCFFWTAKNIGLISTKVYQNLTILTWVYDRHSRFIDVTVLLKVARKSTNIHKYLWSHWSAHKSVLIHHPLRRGHKFPMVLTTSYPLPSQLKIEICFVFLFQITSKVVCLQRIVHRFLEAQI